MKYLRGQIFGKLRFIRAPIDIGVDFALIAIVQFAECSLAEIQSAGQQLFF